MIGSSAPIRRRFAAIWILVTIGASAVAGCSDGRKAPATLPASKRRARSVFVVVGGRESSGSGVQDSLHNSWAQVVFARRFPPGTIYVNLSRNDTTVAAALAEQVPLALQQKPTLTTVWLGEGDDDEKTPPAEFARDLRSLLSRLRNGGRARVLVASPPAGVPGAQYAPAIAQAARNTGAEVVTLSPAAWDPHARRHGQVEVQAAAAAELGRALKP